jgi:general secretion pathway protein M
MKWTRTLEARWQAWWPELGAREQRLVIAGGVLVAVALFWWIGLAPALHTLSSAPAEHAQLDAQLQNMTNLQAQAKALQSQPRASRDDAMLSLESSVREDLRGTGQLQSAGAGEGATVAVHGASAETLAQWFAQVRGNARAVPREVHLTRNTQPGGRPAAPGSAPGATGSPPGGEPTGARWDGTLVMSLPAR